MDRELTELREAARAEYAKIKRELEAACAAREGYRRALIEAYKRIAQLEQANAILKGGNNGSSD